MPKKGTGKIGHEMGIIQSTKDELGFDRELVDRCSAYEGSTAAGIKNAREKKSRVRRELSGERDKQIKNAVTLAEFSWD